jgi:hypothetical protein
LCRETWDRKLSKCSIGSSLPEKTGMSGTLNLPGRSKLDTSSVNIDSLC